ncbi:hypothetical protein GJ496_000865 [Pomphorhynchus laevis]|nr:hypothetical protein GJ496_000865 [Pomphorhynchus laevis]
MLAYQRPFRGKHGILARIPLNGLQERPFRGKHGILAYAYVSKTIQRQACNIYTPSSCETLTEELSKHIDSLLKPLSKHVPSHLLSPFQFLKHIEPVQRMTDGIHIFATIDMDLITVGDLCKSVSALENMYDVNSIRHKFGFTISHTDVLAKLNFNSILNDDELKMLVEVNKAEQSIIQQASGSMPPWSDYLNSHGQEKIQFLDNPDVLQICTDRYNCSICRVNLPNFSHYLFHSLGHMHNHRRRRASVRANKIELSSWDKLVHILCEADIKLNDVTFEYWAMPDNMFKVRMNVCKYKFQTCGTDFKSMRLKVIDKALEFAEANLSINHGFRIVRFPYISGVERAPVVIDNIKSTYLYSLPKPINDDSSVPIETIVNEEKRRYGKYLMEVFRKAHLTSKMAFCDICDSRLPEGLCAAHLSSRRHFLSTLDLLPMRNCIEISLICGIPIEEIDNYQEISTAFKELEKSYRAPFELCDLQKRYCQYFCAFCLFSIRHSTELEKHIHSANHIKNMEAKDALPKENFKNLALMKEYIRSLLIPDEHKKDISSVEDLPESVKNSLPLNSYTDELIDKSIESALNDPETLIERSIARFVANQLNDKLGGRRRKRNHPGGRNRGNTGAAKRLRQSRANFYRDSNVRAALRTAFSGAGSSADHSALSTAADNSRSARMAASMSESKFSRGDSRRVSASTEELRRRRSLALMYAEESMLRSGIRRSFSPMHPTYAASDRFAYNSRPTNIVSDRLRDNTGVGYYDTNQRNVAFGGQWLSGSGTNLYDNRQWSRPMMNRSEYSDSFHNRPNVVDPTTGGSVYSSSLAPLSSQQLPAAYMHHSTYGGSEYNNVAVNRNNYYRH